MTLDEAAQATGGTLIGDGSRRIRGISTDSRAIEPGGLFVALKGLSHDGHAYVAAAAARGAGAAVVARRATASIDRIEVDDTLDALGRLARYHVGRLRARRPIPSIAIGGAVGKTTTKELTTAAVRALYGRTLATIGNLNNLVGVPLMLLGLDENHQAMVIECGTNSPGEIAPGANRGARRRDGPERRNRAHRGPRHTRRRRGRRSRTVRGSERGGHHLGGG